MPWAGGDTLRISKRIAYHQHNAEPHPRRNTRPPVGHSEKTPAAQQSSSQFAPCHPLPPFGRTKTTPNPPVARAGAAAPAAGRGVCSSQSSVAYFREGFRVRSVHRHRHHAHQMLLMVSCGSGAGAPRAGALSPPVTAP